MASFIGSLPTTDSSDLKLANAIISGSKSTVGSTEKLEKSLKNIFEGKEIFLFNRGREALYFALKTLGIGMNDEVITQAFTCVAVVTPILWLNAKPVYVDINSNDFNMDIESLKTKITDKTKVIIVQHTFGNIVDVKMIKEIVGDRDVCIIEDCAHLFSTDFSNTGIGKYSDISLFSFAQDKAISCVQGGLVVMNGKKLQTTAIMEYEKVVEQSTAQTMYYSRYIKLWSTIKKYYFTPLIPFQKRITLGKVLAVVFRALGLTKRQAIDSVEVSPHMHRISDTQSLLLLKQLEKCDKLNNHRVEVKKIYEEILSKEIMKTNSENILLRYPILVNNPAVLLSKLSQEKYICGRWYGSVIFPLNMNLDAVGYTVGDCPTAEILTTRVINLPLDMDVSIDDATAIAQIVNNYVDPFKFNY